MFSILAHSPFRKNNWIYQVLILVLTRRSFSEAQDSGDDDVAGPEALVELDPIFLESPNILATDLSSEGVDEDDVSDADDVKLREPGSHS